MPKNICSRYTANFSRNNSVFVSQLQYLHNGQICEISVEPTPRLSDLPSLSPVFNALRRVKIDQLYTGVSRSHTHSLPNPTAQNMTVNCSICLAIFKEPACLPCGKRSGKSNSFHVANVSLRSHFLLQMPI